jgi:hypothetical protein
MSKIISPDSPVFYVYIYLDPRKPGKYIYDKYAFDHEPFYVGKGHNNRCYKHWKHKTNNNEFDEKINNIRKQCGYYPIVKIEKEHLTEKKAYLLETILIEKIGKKINLTGPLCNINGGKFPVLKHKSQLIIKNKKLKKQRLTREEYLAHRALMSKEHIDEWKKKIRYAHGITDERLEQAKTLIHQGISMRKISQITKITVKTLRKYFKNIAKEHRENKRIERNKVKEKLFRYLITCPDGTTVKIYDLGKFCKENNLTRQGFHYAKKKGNRCKGYDLERIIPNK